MAFTTDSRVHRFASYITFTTDSRLHRFASRSQFTTDSRVHRFSDKAFQTGHRVHRFASIRTFVTDSRVHRFQADPPPSADSGDVPEFEWVTKGGSLSNRNIVPVVSFSGVSGISALDCDAATVVITSSENTTSTLTVNLNDRKFKYHPYGNGSLKDLMGEGEEIAVNVVWGGQSKTFHSIMKRPKIDRTGLRSPAISWSGVGHSSKLFKSKKTLQTLGAIGQPTGLTNHDIFEEICDLVNLDFAVKGVKPTLVAGPYHRQQLQPSAVAAQMLDLTLDNWRDEEDRFVAYNPEKAGQRWSYTIGEDIMFRWSIAPEDNDVYDKVVVLRAIAGGKLQSTGSNVYTEVSNFGETTVSFSPPMSAITTKVEYADYRASFSDFRYDTPGGTKVRAPKGYWGPDFTGGAIINCSSCTFTWGAKTPEVSAQGITSAPGAISFYGIPHRSGTTGEGDNAIGPSDYTTRVTAGSGDEVLEFSPNPLLPNASAMQYLADKALRRLGKPWIQHVFELPLNHLLTVGDYVTITGDSNLGGGVLGTFEVVSTTHVVSRIATERKTTVTLRELLS